jgi:hypothetical protein
MALAIQSTSLQLSPQVDTEPLLPPLGTNKPNKSTGTAVVWLDIVADNVRFSRNYI